MDQREPGEKIPDGDRTIQIKTIILENEVTHREKCAEISRLRDELDASQSNRQRLLEQLSELTKRQVTDAKEMEALMEELAGKYDALKQDKQSIELELEAATSEVDQLKQDRKEEARRIVVLEQKAVELKDTEQKLEVLRIKMDKEHLANLRLKEAAEIFESEVIKMDTVVEEKSAELARLTEMRAQMSTRVGILEAEKTRLENENQKITRELESFRTKWSDVEEEYRRAEWDWGRAAEVYADGIAKLEQERNGLKETVKTLETELKESRSGHLMTSRNMEKLRLSYVELQDTAQERLSDLVYFKGQSEELTLKVVDLEDRNEGLSRELATSTHNFAKLEVETGSEIHNLKATVLKLTKDLEESKRPKKTLAEKIFGKSSTSTKPTTISPEEELKQREYHPPSNSH